MSTATLQEVRNRIKSNVEIDSSDTQHDDDIDDSVRSAIVWFEGQPFAAFEAKTTLTLSSGTDNVSLPSDFAAERRKGVRLLVGSDYYYDNNGFSGHDWDILETRYRGNLQSGQPRNFAIYAGKIYVDMMADQDYTISLSYYKKDATLPTSNSDTSIMFVKGELYDAVRTRALCIFKDEYYDYEMPVTQVDEQRALRYEKNAKKRNVYRRMSGDKQMPTSPNYGWTYMTPLDPTDDRDWETGIS